MGGVAPLDALVQFVQHGTDERRFADVLADADALGVGGPADRRVAAIRKANRGRMKGHKRT
jgi:hypothetical protein